MLVVDGSIFAAFLFAYIHTSMRLEICPPPGSHLPAPSWPVLSCALLLAGSLLMEWVRRSRQWAGLHRLAILIAMACMLVSFWSDLHGQQLAGLDPTAHAWGATVAAMLAYQGLHAVVLTILALYLCARSLSGKLTATSRATLDNCTLVWHYTTVQGLAAAAAIHLMAF
jgi:cytochrome c oxidase subunit I+III